jgi:SAP domain-containing ribonucleoprotein
LFPFSQSTSSFYTTIMSEAKLKTLKVVDLKDILSKASVSVPAKANKQDLVARILGSPAALAVYNKQQNPNASTSAAPTSATATDDLVCASDTLHCTGRSYILFFLQLAPPEERVVL